MKVFIFGATGSVGFPVAQAFVRHGHIVFGQTRSGNNVKRLEAEEINAVVADLAKVEQWIKYAEKADVVVECVSGMAGVSQAIFAGACEAAKTERGLASPKMTYIYCAGTWVYGDDRKEVKSERQPGNNPIPFAVGRPEFEQSIVSSTVVDGIVVRSSFVYGRSGSVLSSLFHAAQPGKEITWPGTKGGRWVMIHVDDLADLFVKLGEAGQICKGLFFDAANDATESVDDILESLVRLSCASGFSYRAPTNPFEEAIPTTTLLRPSLARSLVGWRPLKPSFVDGLRQYYTAWKANL